MNGQRLCPGRNNLRPPYLERCCFLLAPFFFIAFGAAAGPIVVPPDKQDGNSWYRLVFVTTITRDATSTDIADYDAFVKVATGLSPELWALGLSWRAIVSTDTVSAPAQIGAFPEPIYNLAGQLVRKPSADLWDGFLENPIMFDEMGNERRTYVWTGTSDSGDGSIAPLGASRSFYGLSYLSALGWAGFGLDDPVESFSFYALSEPLQAPPVPEPAMSLAVAISVALMWGIGKRVNSRVD